MCNLKLLVIIVELIFLVVSACFFTIVFVNVTVLFFMNVALMV